MPIELIQGVIGGFASSFNKDRYKSDYHYATNDIKAQNEQLKKAIAQAKQAQKEQQKNAVKYAQQDITLTKKPMQTDSKTKPAIYIGSALAIVIILFFVFRKPKRKKNLI